MFKKLFSQRISDILSALLVLLFLYTGLSKLMDHKIFLIQLMESPWLWLSQNKSWVTWFLPIGEILISIALIIPRFRIIGYWSSALLLITFILYISILMVSGIHLPCSCGGIMASLSWTQHIFVNFIFLLVSIWGIVIENKGSGLNMLNSSHLLQVITKQ